MITEYQVSCGNRFGKLSRGKRRAFGIQVLAPSNRAVQVTENPALLCRETYPKLKQELKRKYPKHEWRRTLSRAATLVTFSQLRKRESVGVCHAAVNGGQRTRSLRILRARLEFPVFGLDAVRGVVEHRKETFSQFGTEIHDIFGSGDRVLARLTHRGVGGGIWRSRLGSYDIRGKAVTWNAIAIFRFEDDRIIEEWVTRDELGVILQLGIFQTA